MPITNTEAWQTYVDKNDNPYGKACVDVAREAMRLLDERPGPINTHKIICDGDEASGVAFVSTREEAIANFRSWLAGTSHKALRQERRAWILENLYLLRNKDLVCWCAPKECHCEVYMELLKNISRLASAVGDEGNVRIYRFCHRCETIQSVVLDGEGTCGHQMGIIRGLRALEEELHAHNEAVSTKTREETNG